MKVHKMIKGIYHCSEKRNKLLRKGRMEKTDNSESNFSILKICCTVQNSKEVVRATKKDNAKKRLGLITPDT